MEKIDLLTGVFSYRNTIICVNEFEGKFHAKVSFKEMNKYLVSESLENIFLLAKKEIDQKIDS